MCSCAGPASSCSTCRCIFRPGLRATPPRIVSLAPNLAEMAFTAGAGADVVATVEYSDFPAAARSIPRIGDAFRVDLERLVGLKPDVVLAWETGTPVVLIERVRELG